MKGRGRDALDPSSDRQTVCHRDWSGPARGCPPSWLFLMLGQRRVCPSCQETVVRPLTDGRHVRLCAGQGSGPPDTRPHLTIDDTTGLVFACHSLRLVRERRAPWATGCHARGRRRGLGVVPLPTTRVVGGRQSLIRAMHERLPLRCRGREKQPGKIRRAQNWIGDAAPLKRASSSRTVASTTWKVASCLPPPQAVGVSLTRAVCESPGAGG